MNDTRHDLGRLARVRDEELAGRESGPAARTLLAGLTAEPAPERPVAAWRRPVRRLALAAAVAVVAVVAAVAGPALLPDGATSYANSAIEIHRDGDDYVARIKDPLADGARYAEAFRAVGLDVEIELVPVSPRLVGMLLSSGSGGSGLGGNRVRTDVVGDGTGPVDCAKDPGRCTIVVRISADSSGWIRFKIGRAARPGEELQDCAGPAGCPQRPGSGESPLVSGPGASAGGGN
jgi:hypothetical protein